ncbi:MAG: ribosome small subunit-dependent GTPase A [Eubacterium sp.]
MTEGKIIKGIGGFYYVETAEAVYECKAKGSFRNMKLSPLVGDNVEISVNINAENRIEKILSRKNELVRPPLANLDQLFIVASLVDPVINTFIIDKLIAVAEYKGIEPVVVLTKTDLSSTYEDYKKIYDSAGFKTILCSNADKSGTEEIKALLSGKVSAFTGNTGVGKSTLLNSVDENLMLKTGETSKKLGRGKHTTRHSELFKVCGGYVADTPGFSSLEFERIGKVMKEDLFDCFREFESYFGKCRFSTCSHIGEKGCAVCEAVEKGEIERSRHESYVQMYNEVKDIKEWEIKK